MRSRFSFRWDKPSKPGGASLWHNGPTLGARILDELRPYRWRVAGLLLLGLLATPLLLLVPLPLKVAIDSVAGSEPLPGFLDAMLPEFVSDSKTWLLLAMAILQVLIVLGVQLQAVASYVGHTRVGERVTLAFRAKLFRHAQRLSLSFHDIRGTTDSIYRIQYDAPAVQYIVDSILPFASLGVSLLATLYVTARIDWQLALVAILVMPFLFFLSRAYNGRVRGGYKNLRSLESSALGVVQEALTAVRVVKAFGREDGEQQRFMDRSGEGVRARVKLSFTEGAFGLVVNVVTAVGTVLVMFVGIRNVQAGTLSLGELLLVMGYLTQLYAPLTTISQKIADLQSSLASAERALELLDEMPEVEERPDARNLDRAEGRIELDHVSFSYGGHEVLQDLSFEIEAGARVGVAGRTGAGKTTLLSLLMRFYDPCEGRILLDGVDLRDFKLADLRNQFALVLQEPVLFSTTIAENIAYARPDASFEKIIEAATAANADGFIRSLPAGYDTLVGERGMRLSGGERQRVSLARAFLKDAPLLILDEPTSSVDLDTEAKILEAMERLMTGRTALMIAHRVNTLAGCNVHLQLEEGRLVDTSSQRPPVEISADEIAARTRV